MEKGQPRWAGDPLDRRWHYICAEQAGKVTPGLWPPLFGCMGPGNVTPETAHRPTVSFDGAADCDPPRIRLRLTP